MKAYVYNKSISQSLRHTDWVFFAHEAAASDGKGMSNENPTTSIGTMTISKDSTKPSNGCEDPPNGSSAVTTKLSPANIFDTWSHRDILLSTIQAIKNTTEKTGVSHVSATI
jgi:hypothetical protein